MEVYSGLIKVHAPVVVWFALWVCRAGFVELLWKGLWRECSWGVKI